MKIKIKKLSDNAMMPTKAHPTDAGFDLYATSRTIDNYGNVVYGTGLAFEIPEGYAGFLFPRSSNAKMGLLLSNSVGVIDCHYRGEVTMKFKPSLEATAARNPRITSFEYFQPDHIHRYSEGERIGQLIIMPIPEVEFEFANELSETDRGEGGYGSTGR